MKSIKLPPSQQGDGHTMVEVTIQSDPKYRGNVEQLRQHPLYRDLREGQRGFLESSLATGDKMEAVHSVGTYSSEQSANSAADRYLRHWRVRYLLAEYRGHPVTEDGTRMSKREMEFLMAQRLRSGEVSDSTFCDLAYQLSVMKGWVKEKQKGERLGKPSREEKGSRLPDTKDYFARIKEMEQQQRYGEAESQP